MTTLDDLLDAMTAKEATELVLKSGEIPSLRTAGDVQKVARVAIPEAQVVKLVSAIASESARSSIEARSEARFPYREFAVAVTFPPGGAEVRIVPSSQPALRAATLGTEKPRRIDELLSTMIERRASDLHLTSQQSPRLRIDGEMAALDVSPVGAEEMAELLWPVCPSRNREEWERDHDTDFAYEIPGLARFRCNYFMDRFGMGAVFRQIPTRIPTVQQLGVPKQVLDFCWLSKGFVVVTGPTGSGKSTTLAALIDFINENRAEHIVTIEDPIEFVHPNKRCLLNQREVGAHTESFKRALRAALREDPDIVLVGEMRDLETIAIAIETAETGHLVFGTLHTTTAPSTIERIIDQFPADRQPQIRVMLSESLKGVIAQTLCRRIGGGRVAAFEILVVNTAIANLIREGKTFQIPSIMQSQQALGNAMLNSSLIDLVKRGVVEPQEAFVKAGDKTSLLTMFERGGIRFQPPREASS